MKRILLLSFFTVLVQGFANAQLVTVTGDLIYAGTLSNPDHAELKTHLDVINASGSTRTIKVYRQLIDVIPGSQNRFCWGGVCYDYNDNISFLSNEMTAGQTILADDLVGFVGYYNHLENAGCSHINYCFFDAEDNTWTTCIEVRFAVDAECVVGFSEQKERAVLSLNGQNPVQDSFNIEFELGSSYQNTLLVIRNVMGSVVKEVNLNANRGFVMFDAAEFASGLYIYSLQSGNQIIASDQFVVSK